MSRSADGRAVSAQVGEKEAREVAEASRQIEWNQPSFMREMFLGNFRLDLIHPYPQPAASNPEFDAFFLAMKELLTVQVDSREIDRTGEYPENVLDALRKLGAFGMKIPKEYGGLGFSNREYQEVMKLVGGVDGNLSALLSAHQSIGVPQPLKLFGSRVLKDKYLPRCAAGEISAFALTEPDVGSDPARLATTVVKTPEGDYRMNGVKLWCTNGTLAKLLVVMAVDPETRKISAFVVETDWPGVEVVTRCHFMGLKALANAVIRFTDVRVPAENLIGKEGRGLKIALTTLNDGRLSIPNGSVGSAKVCLEICRRWTRERVQWGKPIGKHEAIAHRTAEVAAYTFAMESIASLATAMADEGKHDIRLEAAACKLWNSERTWEMIDKTMQIRGGRGYETEDSLANRGEEPIGVERLMRDYRINRIFEGSSEIMHLLMAREAVDKHLEVAGALIDPDAPLGRRIGAFLKSGAFYALWYPTRWLGWGRWPRYGSFGRLATHLRFADRSTRKLARQVFHAMNVYRGRLQYKQGFLFRVVDIANELFAVTATVARAEAMRRAGDPDADHAIWLADAFCRMSRRTVRQTFRDLWRNDDVLKYKLGVAVMDGEHRWLEAGGVSVESRLAAEAERLIADVADVADVAPTAEPTATAVPS